LAAKKIKTSEEEEFDLLLLKWIETRQKKFSLPVTEYERMTLLSFYQLVKKETVCRQSQTPIELPLSSEQ